VPEFGQALLGELHTSRAWMLESSTLSFSVSAKVMITQAGNKYY
jgi:hypothetical protein